MRLIKQILEHSTLCYYQIIGKTDISELHSTLELKDWGGLRIRNGKRFEKRWRDQSVEIQEEMMFNGPCPLAT